LATGDLAGGGAPLQLEGGDLLGEFEQLGVLGVDGAHRLAQAGQVLLLVEQVGRVLVGLLPQFGEGGEFIGHRAAAAGHRGAFHVAAVGDCVQQAVELFPAALQFGEGAGLALQGQLTGLGKLLGKGAHLTGCCDIGGAEGADPDLVEHERDGQRGKDQEGDAQQAQLFGSTLAREKGQWGAGGPAVAGVEDGVHVAGGCFAAAERQSG